MIHSHKVILKNLRKLAGNTEAELCLYGDCPLIGLTSNDEKTYDCSKYAGELTGAIDYLVKTGYLEYGNNKYFFYLTAKGVHPYSFAWETFKDFMIKSILVPIVVSFGTSLITLAISALLSQPSP